MFPKNVAFYFQGCFVFPAAQSLLTSASLANSKCVSVTPCLQVWIGYNQSLRPCQSGLTLNMDITAAAFLEGQPMLQLIGSTVGMQNLSGGLNPAQVRVVNKAIRGVQVNHLLCVVPLTELQQCWL